VYKDKKILALITARGGSKGIPGKNIADLGGKPLLAWTVEAGLGSRYIDRLVLTSDDDAIIQVARQHGCDVPFVRPAHLAQDDTSSMDVIMHALEEIQESFDYLVLLQPTSPFRNAAHIDAMIEYTFAHAAQMVVSVSKTKKSPTLMFYRNADDTMLPVVDGGNTYRRQDAKTAYEYNGAIYVSAIDYLKEVKSYKTPAVLGFELQAFQDIDIDEPNDLAYARYIAGNKLY
jgi:N-acylneuraminate cytidylyltransferase